MDDFNSSTLRRRLLDYSDPKDPNELDMIGLPFPKGVLLYAMFREIAFDSHRERRFRVIFFIITIRCINFCRCSCLHHRWKLPRIRFVGLPTKFTTSFTNRTSNEITQNEEFWMPYVWCGVIHRAVHVQFSGRRSSNDR